MDNYKDRLLKEFEQKLFAEDPEFKGIKLNEEKQYQVDKLHTLADLLKRLEGFGFNITVEHDMETGETHPNSQTIVNIALPVGIDKERKKLLAKMWEIADSVAITNIRLDHEKVDDVIRITFLVSNVWEEFEEK